MLPSVSSPQGRQAAAVCRGSGADASPEGAARHPSLDRGAHCVSGAGPRASSRYAPVARPSAGLLTVGETLALEQASAGPAVAVAPVSQLTLLPTKCPAGHNCRGTQGPHTPGCCACCQGGAGRGGLDASSSEVRLWRCVGVRWSGCPLTIAQLDGNMYSSASMWLQDARTCFCGWCRTVVLWTRAAAASCRLSLQALPLRSPFALNTHQISWLPVKAD